MNTILPDDKKHEFIIIFMKSSTKLLKYLYKIIIIEINIMCIGSVPDTL